MKKTFSLITLGLLATTLGTYATTAQAATTGDTAVTSQVTAGELSMTATDALTFDALTYTGSSLTALSNGNATVTVSDARGNFAGWGVTVQQSQADGQTWGTGMALTLTDTTDSAKTVAISTTSTNAFSQAASPTIYDVEQAVTYSGSLSIPASVKAGTYATTLTWTLGATPTA